MPEDDPEGPTTLEAVVHILIAVLVVSAATALLGSVVAQTARVLAVVITFAAAITGLGGWFTDVLDPPRGRLTQVRPRGPRRRRRVPKGSAQRTRRRRRRRR